MTDEIDSNFLINWITHLPNIPMDIPQDTQLILTKVIVQAGDDGGMDVESIPFSVARMTQLKQGLQQMIEALNAAGWEISEDKKSENPKVILQHLITKDEAIGYIKVQAWFWQPTEHDWA